ncbi:hypothetical protein ES703_117632 [subsurface metagenome]
MSIDARGWRGRPTVARLRKVAWNGLSRASAKAVGELLTGRLGAARKIFIDLTGKVVVR